MLDTTQKILKVFEPYVPLMQTLTWPAFILFIIVYYRSSISSIISVIKQRVEKGCSVKAGLFEIGSDLKQLERIEISSDIQNQLVVETAQQWELERNKIYETNKGIFLTHVLEPSRAPVGSISNEQWFDIYIYLIIHKSNKVTGIKYAEFFFGHMWGNVVFKEEPKNGRIGVATSAYGPFLCTCRVHFEDGNDVFLYRYIDFEMGNILKTNQ